MKKRNYGKNGRKIKKILLLSIFIFVLISGFIIFLIKDNFIVKNIEIERNFELNKTKLLDYLGIEEKKYIWSYNIKYMEEKLSMDPNLSTYKITKKYPDTLVIELKMKTPMAAVCGDDGKIFFIDEKGIIFSKYMVNYNLPLIIYNNKISQSMKTGHNITHVIDSLIILREKDKKVYDGISQIEIYEKNSGLTEYVVIYRTINQRIYLKNYINVDLLKEGFVCSLYMEENGNSDRNVYYSGAGFVF